MSQTSAAPSTGSVDLVIGGMTCASCAARIEKKLNKVPGVVASVNYATETAHVSVTDPAVDSETLISTAECRGNHSCSGMSLMPSLRSPKPLASYESRPADSARSSPSSQKTA